MPVQELDNNEKSPQIEIKSDFYDRAQFESWAAGTKTCTNSFFPESIKSVY